MLPENVKRNGSNIISMDHRLGLQKATKKKQYEKKLPQDMSAWYAYCIH